MRKKEYIKPKISAIELNPEQAVLLTCKAAQGVWMIGGTFCAYGSGAAIFCSTGPRVYTRGASFVRSTDSAGS